MLFSVPICADALSGAFLIVDGRTAEVLESENADVQLPMASTTKVMTALLAIEHTADLDALIQIPDGAVGVEGSSMYLNRGESLSMRDLLYGLMLTSGNDAAVAIAMTVGGSVEGFAELMNQRARELGCENTNFVTPNGLHDDQHYTTARDLAAISAEAMKNPTFREVVGTTYHETTTGDRKRTLKNKNKQCRKRNSDAHGSAKHHGRNEVQRTFSEDNVIILVYARFERTHNCH